jgi:hypothetical protein
LRIDKPRPRDILADPDMIALNVKLHALLYHSKSKAAAQ